MRKTQTILLVLFFMILVVLLTTTLFFLLRQEMRTQRQREHALVAFYLAQAGIEQAKIDALSSYWAVGTYYFPGPGQDSWLDDLYPDLPDDYSYQYNYILENPGGNTRVITGQGQVLKDSEILAFKRLRVEIDGIEDTLGDGQDDNLEGTQISWEEL